MSSENMNWMYEGKSSSIDREAYLLGKRISKATENEGDFIVKDQTENVSVLERLDFESKLREDPLISIRKKEEAKRRELLSNPVKRKHLQDTLKQALQKELGQKAKNSCSVPKKKRKESSDYDGRKHSHHRHGSHKSSKHQASTDRVVKSASNDKRLQKALKKALEKDLKKSSKHISSDSSSDESSGDEKQYRHPVKSCKDRKHSKKTESRRKIVSQIDEYSDSSSKTSTNACRSPKQSGYGLIVMDPQSVRTKTDLKLKPSEPVKEKYKRKEKAGFTRKLSKEELEKRRKEMMDSAGWRDEQRKKNVKHYEQRQKLTNERESHIQKLHDAEEKKHGKVKTFLHKVKMQRADVGSLEDTVRRKRHTLTRPVDD